MTNKRKVVLYVGLLAGGWAAANVYSQRKRHLRRRHVDYVHHREGQHGASYRANVAILARNGAFVDRRPGNPNRRSGAVVGVYAAAILGWYVRELVAQWWNPASWWGDIGGAVSAVGNGIKQLIHDGVDFAIRTVEGVLDTAIGILTDTIDGVANLAHGAWNFLQGVYGEVLHIAEVDLPAWFHDAVNTAAGWVRDVEHSLDDVFHWAASTFDAIRHDLASAVDWVVHNIWDPLISWVEHAGEWWAHLFDAAWNWIYQHVIAPLEHLAAEAWHYVTELWDWFVRVAKDAVELVIKSADWLIWFALNPVSGIKELVHEALQALSLKAVLNAIETDGEIADTVVEEMTKWIA